MTPVIVAICQNNSWFHSLECKLADRGLSLIRSSPGARAVTDIDRHMAKLVIVDTGMDPDDRVLACIGRIKNLYPTLPVFLIAKNSNESLAIRALKAGVDDYFKMPLCIGDILLSIEKILSSVAFKRTKLGKNCFSMKMVGKSRLIEELKDLLAQVSVVDSTVLITGETGTGKELAAALIHENSARAHRPIVSVNCAALPDNLVESELFGYERGAFTGAVTTTRGRFEQAEGGTLFLDEIGDMPSYAQAKILRVIEDKQISHLGCGSPIPLNFRLIAATNREPELLIEEGAFREDLFYRLNVARVHMPSLREHREDIPLLVDFCINRLNWKFGRDIKGLKEDSLELLYRYNWPGNVRELMNILEGAFICQPDTITGKMNLPPYFKKKFLANQFSPSEERRRIVTALLEANWNKSAAAKKLKWSRMTLYRKIAKYRIVEKRFSRSAVDT